VDLAIQMLLQMGFKFRQVGEVHGRGHVQSSKLSGLVGLALLVDAHLMPSLAQPTVRDLPCIPQWHPQRSASALKEIEHEHGTSRNPTGDICSGSEDGTDHAVAIPAAPAASQPA
jgi:hypothetical protein